MHDDNTPVDPMADQMIAEDAGENTEETPVAPATPVDADAEMDAEGETEAEAPVAPVVEEDSDEAVA